MVLGNDKKKSPGISLQDMEGRLDFLIRFFLTKKE